METHINHRQKAFIIRFLNHPLAKTYIIPLSSSIKARLQALSAIFLSISLLLIIDSSIYSRRKLPSENIGGIKVWDYMNYILCIIGYIIISGIPKRELLNNEEEDYDLYGTGSNSTQLKFVLFCGFTILGLGCSGEIVRFLINYLLKNDSGVPLEWEILCVGFNAMFSCIFVMLSCMILWLGQSLHKNDNEEYRLTL
ncbi:hypothetical protein FOG50_02717 [Hanseniaspora uvarum]|nr:hypothetical protein FOG50_02717 [Hanseniaspora uvarum]